MKLEITEEEQEYLTRLFESQLDFIGSYDQKVAPEWEHDDKILKALLEKLEKEGKYE